MARETGLEPAASAVTGRRSNQLSYSRGCRNPKRLPRIGPQREQGLKARLSLVKVVANPLVLQALLRFRCKKWLIFQQNGVGGLTSNHLRPATSGFPRASNKQGGPNMATKETTATTITLK